MTRIMIGCKIDRKDNDMKPQLHVGKLESIQKGEKFPVKNHSFNKPKGILWTSTYSGEYGSDWVQWCLQEDYKVPDDRKWNSYLIIPNDEANIFVIDDKKDAKLLYDRYGELMFPSTKFDSKMLNFVEIAKDFDAIHLTEKGQSETRLLLPNGFYGWDCESTAWFTAAFTFIKYMGNMEFYSYSDDLEYFQYD